MPWHLLAGHKPFLKLRSRSRKAHLEVNPFTSKTLLPVILLERPVTEKHSADPVVFSYLCNLRVLSLFSPWLSFLPQTVCESFYSKSRTLADSNNGTKGGLETYFLGEGDLRWVWGFRGHVRTDWKDRGWASSGQGCVWKLWRPQQHVHRLAQPLPKSLCPGSFLKFVKVHGHQ